MGCSGPQKQFWTGRPSGLLFGFALLSALATIHLVSLIFITIHPASPIYIYIYMRVLMHFEGVNVCFDTINGSFTSSNLTSFGG